MPFLSPSASANARPRQIAVSSTEWWSSICRSPLHVTSRSKSPWRANSSSMWSRNGTPVETALLPSPSRSSLRWMSVSLVARLISAWRDIRKNLLQSIYQFVVLFRRADADANVLAEHRRFADVANQNAARVQSFEQLLREDRGFHAEEVPRRRDRLESIDLPKFGEKAVALPLHLLDEGPQQMQIFERHFGRRHRKEVQAVGHFRLVEFADQLRRGKAVTDAQPAHRHRLRERSQDDQILVFLEQREEIFSPDLQVGLVDDDDPVAVARNRRQVARADHAAGRVVRRTDDGQAGFGRDDLARQSREVERQVFVERNRYDFAAGHGDYLAVDGKRRLGKDDAHAFLDDRVNDRLDHLVRPVARHYPVFSPSSVFGELFEQRCRGELRIARPIALHHATHDFLFDLARNAERIFILIDLDRRFERRERVCGDRADIRFDFIQR